MKPTIYFLLLTLLSVQVFGQHRIKPSEARRNGYKITKSPNKGSIHMSIDNTRPNLVFLYPGRIYATSCEHFVAVMTTKTGRTVKLECGRNINKDCYNVYSFGTIQSGEFPLNITVKITENNDNVIEFALQIIYPGFYYGIVYNN